MPAGAAGAAALPAYFEFTAPTTWRAVDFISDLHLCESMPATFQAWERHLRHTPADAVFILGDLFEVWVGDDARSRTFERRCVDVLADAASHRQLAFVAGNRDFLVGPAMRREAGLMALPDPTVFAAWGQRVLLTHGDALCLSDVAYQQFRAWTRNPATQTDFLSRPLAERVKLGAGIRHASEAGRRQAPPAGGWADLDTAAAVACLQAAGATTMLHGHTHRPGRSVLAPGFDRQVLCDWDLDEAPPRAEVLRLSRAGIGRLALDAATRA